MPAPVPRSMENDADWERMNSRTKTVNSSTSDGREALGDIRKDFVQIQLLTNELIKSVVFKHEIEYKRIAETAGKIKTLAGRLDSNLALGKSKGAEPRTEYEFNDAALESSLRSLHRFVRSFVENPIFKEKNVVDVQATKKAKQDVDSIIAVSEQVKKIARRLNKDPR